MNDITNKQSNFTKNEKMLSEATVLEPSLDGYWFKGWNTKADGTGSGYPGAEKMLSNKTFYAKWQRATYTVHFDDNNESNPNHEIGEFTQNTATGTMDDQVIDYDTDTNLNTNRFVRDGYTFDGWNTKADGSGTSYADGASVRNLVGYDKTGLTLYAKWKKKLGTETITVVSEETGNPVSGVSMKLQKDVNGTWTDVKSGTTDSNGKIAVDNLHWFNYRWVCTAVPAGYVKSGDVSFKITYNELSKTNSVILYMKRVSIKIDSKVSELINGEGSPSFLYHVSGTDVAGVIHNYNAMVRLSDKTGDYTLSDVLSGEYKITQVPVSRYVAENAKNVSHASVDGVNATVNVKDYDKAEVLFPYSLRQYNGFSHMDGETNHVRK